MSNIFPIDFEEKLTMAQDDYILFSDSEDGNKIKKAQYKNLKGEPGTPGTPGTPGKDGEDGAAATISVGTTTTGAAGSSASVTNSGTSSAAVLDFTIPQGAKGEPGEDGQDGADGAAATITVGTTTTLPAGSSATVTNVGTSQDAILNFGIPKGDTGTGSGDVTGPASSTDGHIAVFNGATGKIIRDGGPIPTGDVGVSTDTGTLLSAGVDLWLGTETDFSSISTPDTNTLYIQYKSDGGGGWQPGVNTIAYYPLDSTNTVNDMSGNNYTLTGTGSYNFGTYQGVNCCYISDGQLASYITSQALPTHTENIRYCEVSQPTNDSGLIMGFIKNNAVTGGDFSGLLRSRTFPSNRNGIIACIDDGAAYSSTSYSVTKGVWINVCYVYDNGAISCYVNGVLTSSFSYTWSINYRQIRISRVDQYDRSINGYISNAIFENKARIAQEISDYFNQTKGDYGIS